MGQAERLPGKLALPIIAEMRVEQAMRPLTDEWRRIPVAPRESTLLGVSFRPLQAYALGLDAKTTLDTLLAYPFQLIRLGAYWNRIEPAPGAFSPDALDWQIDAAERAGKQIILNVGAVKTFGYPEYFAPAHQLERPLREGALVAPAAHRALLDAATIRRMKGVPAAHGGPASLEGIEVAIVGDIAHSRVARSN